MIDDARNSIVFSICLACGIALLNASCGSTGIAPVSSRNSSVDKPQRDTPVNQPASPPKTKVSHYVVVKGDTLYSIAWDHDFDYKDVARWNNIAAPYVIYPGQPIRLTPPDKSRTARSAADQPTPPAATPQATHKPVRDATGEKKVDKQPSIQFTEKIRWQWPTEGGVIRSNSPISKKGIDIAGQQGQSIKASAPGIVVYSGSGLLRYGKLIIVKHNETYMSAYAHNSLLMVKEGEKVASGQQIAKMGQDSNGRALLHFQIRKNGTPIGPIKYLPKIQS